MSRPVLKWNINIEGTLTPHFLLNQILVTEFDTRGGGICHLTKSIKVLWNKVCPNILKLHRRAFETEICKEKGKYEYGLKFQDLLQKQDSLSVFTNEIDFQIQNQSGLWFTFNLTSLLSFLLSVGVFLLLLAADNILTSSGQTRERDRENKTFVGRSWLNPYCFLVFHFPFTHFSKERWVSVSYTHLTLPTIYSV